MGKPPDLMVQGLNDESFFRAGGVELDMRGAVRVQQEVGRDPVDGSWYIDLKGTGGHVRSVMTPAQALSLALGILNTLERFGMTIPLDWKRWTPPR